MAELSHQDEFIERLRHVAPTSRRDAVLAAARLLPAPEQQALADALAQPSPATNDLIWTIIIGSFAASLVIAVVALAWALLANATPDPLLTVVTTIVGVFAGLLAPSPLQKSKG